MIKKIIFSLIIFAALIFGLLQLQFVQNKLADYTIRSQIYNALVENSSMPSEDSLSALICGSRSPVIASTERAETCTMIIAGNDVFIIDVGDGSVNNLRNWGVPFDQIKAVLITHLHSDHMLELGGLVHTAWTSGLQHQLAVNGPAGTARVWSHFLEMMEVDIEVRVLDEGRPHLRDLVSVHEYDQGIVTENSDFTVSALRTIHPPLEDCFARLVLDLNSQDICKAPQCIREQ